MGSSTAPRKTMKHYVLLESVMISLNARTLSVSMRLLYAMVEMTVGMAQMNQITAVSTIFYSICHYHSIYSNVYLEGLFSSTTVTVGVSFLEVDRKNLSVQHPHHMHKSHTPIRDETHFYKQS